MYAGTSDIWRTSSVRGMPRIKSHPIVRGKARAPVEFGPKIDVSIDSEGYGRIEKVSFAPYNEGGNLAAAAERYRERMGVYPERILADKIYRTKENRSYCRKNGIRLSGPKLGRPSKDAVANAASAWDLLSRSLKQPSLHRLRYPYSCRICSGFRDGYSLSFLVYAINLWYVLLDAG